MAIGLVRRSLKKNKRRSIEPEEFGRVQRDSFKQSNRPDYEGKEACAMDNGRNKLCTDVAIFRKTSLSVHSNRLTLCLASLIHTSKICQKNKPQARRIGRCSCFYWQFFKWIAQTRL